MNIGSLSSGGCGVIIGSKLREIQVRMIYTESYRDVSGIQTYHLYLSVVQKMHLFLEELERVVNPIKDPTLFPCQTFCKRQRTNHLWELLSVLRTTIRIAEGLREVKHTLWHYWIPGRFDHDPIRRWRIGYECTAFK